ncbi:MAG: TlpA family protein disulfide reductase [Tannerella sp.]|nr:TlpA family protein disulfide reductase [Tannerella sp.]
MENRTRQKYKCATAPRNNEILTTAKKIKKMNVKNKFYRNCGILLFVAIICTQMICAQMICAQSNTVTGYVEGLSNDTVMVMSRPLDNSNQRPVFDTIFVKNGRLEYIFPDDRAYALQFVFFQFFVHDTPNGRPFLSENASLFIFTEPKDRISFNCSINSTGFINVNISGSQLNHDFSTIQNEMLKINENQVEEEMALEQASIDKNKEAEETGWEKRFDRIIAQNELYCNYVRENLDNPLSAFLLSQQSVDSVGMYYDKLGVNVRNSIFRHLLDGAVTRYQDYINPLKAKKVFVGDKAPDFTLEDSDGKSISLSSLRGKYVIIDFWGSWCGPCIVGMPKMKSAYEMYKNKLEILGVACRERTIDVWRDAVKQHELPWTNVYNDNLSAVNEKYGIDTYPTKIVIDPEGTIIFRTRGEGGNFYDKLKSVIEK